MVPPTIEEITDEYVSDKDIDSSEDHDQYDMFFSCADWETQIKQSQQTQDE